MFRSGGLRLGKSYSQPNFVQPTMLSDPSPGTNVTKSSNNTNIDNTSSSAAALDELRQMIQEQTILISSIRNDYKELIIQNYKLEERVKYLEDQADELLSALNKPFALDETDSKTSNRNCNNNEFSTKVVPKPFQRQAYVRSGEVDVPRAGAGKTEGGTSTCQFLTAPSEEMLKVLNLVEETTRASSSQLTIDGYIQDKYQLHLQRDEQTQKTVNEFNRELNRLSELFSQQVDTHNAKVKQVHKDMEYEIKTIENRGRGESEKLERKYGNANVFPFFPMGWER